MVADVASAVIPNMLTLALREPVGVVMTADGTVVGVEVVESGTVVSVELNVVNDVQGLTYAIPGALMMARYWYVVAGASPFINAVTVVKPPLEELTD